MHVATLAYIVYRTIWRCEHVVKTANNPGLGNVSSNGKDQILIWHKRRDAELREANAKHTCKHLAIPLLFVKAVGNSHSRLLAWPSISNK